MKRTSLKSEDRKEIKFRKKLKGKSLAVVLAGGILISVTPNGVVNATTEISTYASAGPIDTSEGFGDIVKGDFVESLLLPNGNAVYVYKESEIKYNMYVRHDGVDGYYTGLRSFSAANGFELKEVENGYMLRFTSYYTGTISNTIYDFEHNIIEQYTGDDTTDTDKVALPSVADQVPVFDRDNPTDVVITGVDFGDYELDYIMYRGVAISRDRLIASDNSITIPRGVLEEMNLEPATSPLVIYFKGKNTQMAVLKVSVIGTYEGDNKPPVNPPADGDDEIVPPVNPPADGDDEIVPPSNGDNSNGDNSNGDEITPPSDEIVPPTNGDKPSDEDKPSNGDKPSDEDKPSSGDNSNNQTPNGNKPSESPSNGSSSNGNNKPSNGSSSNGSSSNGSSLSNQTQTPNGSSNTLPNTGSVASSGLVSMLGLALTSIGSLTLKKKSKRS